MLEDEVAISALKREALTLYDNLRDLEQKRDELVDEENNRGTPAQERERLLSQVKCFANSFPSPAGSNCPFCVHLCVIYSINDTKKNTKRTI
jgi:hypothetical protein